MIKWKAQKTLLIVGEGYDEEAFLKYFKPLLAPRGCGLEVKVKNAGGKSAKHIIEWTIRQIANVDYDQVAVMLDTDTDWSEAISNLARKHKILVLTSTPCFEGVMLRALGKPANGNSETLKRAFAPYVQNDATDSRNYAASFSIDTLINARNNEPSIDGLLKLFGK